MDIYGKFFLLVCCFIFSSIITPPKYYINNYCQTCLKNAENVGHIGKRTKTK